MVARKPVSWAHVRKLCRDAAEEIRSRGSNGKRRTACQGIVDYLMSSRPLSLNEREQIAKLIMGEMGQTRGYKKDAKTRDAHQQQERLVREFYREAAKGHQPNSIPRAVAKATTALKLCEKDREALLKRMTRGSSLIW